MRSYRLAIFALLTPAITLAGAFALGWGARVHAQSSATTAADDAVPIIAATTAPAAMPAVPIIAATTAPAAAASVPARIKSNIPKSNVARPTTDIPQAKCVTPQCHPGVKQFNVLHGPVNVNACDACHTLTSAEKHTFRLARAPAALCTFCHKTQITGPVVHKPVQTGDCLPCHDPHGASNKQFLRGKTMNDLCSACHKNVMAGKVRVHGPASAGACGACHQAHVAQYPKLLVAKGRELCLGCHAEMKRQIDQAKVKHKAVEADCLTCHDAHASNYPMQTRQPPLQLCTATCHEKVKAAATASKYKHSVILADQACLNCHTAHGGELAKLMRTTPVNLCMKCHDKKVDAPGARVIEPVPEVLDPVMIKHGPVAQGNCGGCHDVHGSNVSRLLAKPYSEGFYEPFSLDKYEMCFDCHNKQLVLMKATSSVTGFRNGSTNLHYVHVNKVRQGRSCRACHSTHASTNPMHIRESVPYGNWKLPIQFTPTATGGSCLTGCHRQFAYDRVKALPIDRPEPPPVNKAATTTEPAMSTEEARAKAGNAIVPLTALADPNSLKTPATKSAATRPASQPADDAATTTKHKEQHK
jgi:predicted CXXCH cytochrome family protein